jgi:signal transduction histidine kinase
MVGITSEAFNTRSRDSRNFSTYTLLGIVVAVAIVLSLVSYFYFVSVSNEIEDTIRNGLRQHSENEAFQLCEILEKQIQFTVSSVDIAVNSPSIQRGKVEQGSEVINLAQQRTSSLTDRFFWLDASGKTIWSSAFMNNPEEYEQYRGFDVSDRPYFVEVARANKPYFGPVIKSPIDNNSQRMFISYPVFVDESFRGVVVASIKADQLAKSITEESSPGFESSVEIVDSQGSIVYSQAPEHIGESLFDEKLQSVLQAPAFESQEKLEEFNEFLRMSIDPTIPTEVHSRDFRTVTGDTATIIASAVRVVESEQKENANQHQEQKENANQHQEQKENANQHQILTLYMSTPQNVAAKVAPLVDAQRNYSVAVIAAISAVAIIVSYFIFSSNKRLERTVAERTQELREANERLKEHGRLQSEFINMAAHELRTPVQSLLGAAEMLEDQMLAGEETTRVSKLVEMILRNAKRLAKLTFDILEVSRIESNLLKLQKEQINMQEKIERVIEDVKPFVDEGKQLQIVFEPKVNEPVIVKADRTKLFEVLSNLLRNAIKFTSKGTIKVVLEKSDSEAIVTVQDTGKGIDLEIMPKMFERFATKSDSGTGLGLFISKSIVEAHGGTISAENNPNGIGAKFRFTLPLYIVKSGTEKEPSKS